MRAAISAVCSIIFLVLDTVVFIPFMCYWLAGQPKTWLFVLTVIFTAATFISCSLTERWMHDDDNVHVRKV